jgi:predicted enzyme related to lactoylglutathione lyase
MNKKNPVVHFEIPADDMERMKKFYETAFGWETHQLGPEMGNYVTVMTTETGEDRRPTQPGEINGGFYHKQAEAQHPSIVIAVEDIHEAMKAVEAAGGRVLGGMGGPGEPDDIPGVGLFSGIIDTEGNRVAILQPKRM